MIYINNCKLLIINRCKDIKKYQLLNYSPHPPLPPLWIAPHRSHPCGSHPTARTLSLPVRLAPPRVSPSLSESLRVFFKKYSSHFQLTTKNFQKKLRKNLQDKKNAVPLHPQMRRNTVSKQETTRTLT